MSYKLPANLTSFQREIYIHLIEWKWKNISREAGIYRKKDKKGNVREYEKDAILPEVVRNSYPLIYPSVLNDLLTHKSQFHFKLHDHFHHMASSQAANVNLFLPVLLHPLANDVLRQLNPNFRRLATKELYKGFRIEFWDGNSDAEKGLLGDHSAKAGTDADIGIAYYNKNDELCLWLIEHKLTEKEFTTCGGYRTRQNKNKMSCSNSFDAILSNKNLCHYHRVNKYKYWNLTETNKDLFCKPGIEKKCPFMGGMNQLWRNQLLGLGMEQNGKFRNVFFSVVRHPGNLALNPMIDQYKKLTNNDPRFSCFVSTDVIRAATKLNDEKLNVWAGWYRELYNV